jgi:hypothetical protein
MLTCSDVLNCMALIRPEAAATPTSWPRHFSNFLAFSRAGKCTRRPSSGQAIQIRQINSRNCGLNAVNLVCGNGRGALRKRQRVVARRNRHVQNQGSGRALSSHYPSLPCGAIRSRRTASCLNCDRANATAVEFFATMARHHAQRACRPGDWRAG